MLLVTDSDAFAGTERHILDLAAALSAEGHEAHVGCPDGTPLARRTAAAGLTHRAVSRGTRAGVAALRMARRHGGYDVLHAHNGRGLLMSALAAPSRGGPALVTTRHFIRLSREGRRGPKRWASAALHGWLNRRLDATIAISRAVADAAVAAEPAIRSRLQQVSNGIASPTPLSPADLGPLGVAGGDTRVLLTVARLEVEKQVGLVIEAARRLVDDGGPPFVWLVAGDGAQRDPLERATRSAFGDRSPLRWLGRRGDVPALMTAADVLVHPAPDEPFGLVLVEAMAAGRPVVAGRGGAAPEIIEDRVTGRLFRPGDAASLAATVADVLASGEDGRRAMGLAGRDRFARYFTAARMARQTAAVYDQAIRHAGGRSRNRRTHRGGLPGSPSVGLES
ncbi:MAG: glycosyltransferase family 4 protein [Planctomycetota bacterium]